MSAISSRCFKVNAPDDNRLSWTAILLGAVAFCAAFWRGIVGIFQTIQGAIALCRSVVSRLNAQDVKIADQDEKIRLLQTKDQSQQEEIDDLKTQLAESTKIRIQLAADNLKLQQELAAEKDKLLEKQLQIASLERAQNTTLLHNDAKGIESKIENITAQT